MNVPEFAAITSQRTFARGEGLPGRVWLSGTPTWIPDVVNDGNFPRGPIAAKEKLHGAFGFPILLGQEFLGVIEFFSHQIQEPDADKMEMVGTIGGQIGQFIDRKRSERKVREVTQQLQIVTEGMAAPVTRCSRDLRYLWVSNQYAEWLGRPIHEIVGRPIVEIAGQQAFEQLRPYFDRVLAGQRIQYEEEVNFGRLGPRWINAIYTPTLDAGGVPDGWIAVVLDVTERKQIEEALRQSEQRFARFMQHFPGLAWIKDLQGRYVYANASAAKVFAGPVEEIYGKSDDDLFAPDTAAEFRENDRRALASETGVQFIETLRHEDGTVHHSLVNKFPILGSEENIALVGGMAIDITDRLHAEESLREADRRKNDFLATLAHELRNPLAPLRTGLDLLRLAEGDSATIDEACSTMERQLGHMVRLIDDLLDVSRITRGKLQLRRERIELAQVIRDAIETSRPLIDANCHQFTVKLLNKSVYLYADPTRLAQVFSNLLNNAAKYTEKGGQIALTAEQHAGSVVVSVKDSGIGIAADYLPHIFETFSQTVPALERSQSGLGVGLGLVRGLVELHSGSVEARSAGLGKGSEFLVRLPVVDAPLGLTEPQGTGGRRIGQCRPRRILVVDDNRDSATSMVLLLRMQGHETDTAYDGQEAIQVAARFQPEVMLLDIGMPKMNGYDAARHIRQQPWGKNILLIAVTGWGQEEDKRRALDAGFNYHLAKPVLSADLEKLLNQQPK